MKCFYAQRRQNVPQDFAATALNLGPRGYLKTIFGSCGLKTGNCSTPGIIKGRNLAPKPTVGSDQPWMCPGWILWRGRAGVWFGWRILGWGAMWITTSVCRWSDWHVRNWKEEQFIFQWNWCSDCACEWVGVAKSGNYACGVGAPEEPGCHQGHGRRAGGGRVHELDSRLVRDWNLPENQWKRPATLVARKFREGDASNYATFSPTAQLAVVSSHRSFSLGTTFWWNWKLQKGLGVEPMFAMATCGSFWMEQIFHRNLRQTELWELPRNRFQAQKIHGCYFNTHWWMVQSAWPTWSYGSTSWMFANVWSWSNCKKSVPQCRGC